METIKCIFITITGIVFGSFFACIGYRIPNKISTIKPNSFCPKCKKPLKWYMNIPILSYIFLKGKCAYCKKNISFIYPLVEICGGLLFLLAYITYGFSMNFIIVLVISSAFLITIVSDFLYFYISDRVVVISIIILIIASLLLDSYITAFYKIITGIIMFIIIYLFKKVGDKIFKKESLGGGDIKLMGLIGLSLGTSSLFNGIYLSLLVLIFSSILGLIFAFINKKNKNGIVPFGPFLLLACLFVLYLKNYLLYIFFL